MSALPRVAFLGTPDLAATTLRHLHRAGAAVPLVVTAPDRRRGRGGATSPSPVKAAALELGLRVSHDLDDLLACDAELGVVVAYGRLITPKVLAAMPFVNLHFSLLPRWRGAAPVERAILAGDERTGVCVMEVTEGLDEGGVYARAEVDVGDKTLEELRGELIELGNELLVERLRSGLGVAVPQDGDVTYAHKLTTEDRRIDWTAGVQQAMRVIRLGGAWTTFRGARIRILAAHLDGDRLVPDEVQPEGRSAMAYDAWRQGARPAPGEWFE